MSLPENLLIAAILIACPLICKATEPDFCRNWFQSLDLSPGMPDCELRCAMVENDMSNFDCSSRCGEFCGKPKQKCPVDPYWKRKLDSPTTPFTSFKPSERAVVESALSQLPKDFEPSKLKAIVRASANVDPTATTSPASSSDEFIILFPKAFKDPARLNRIIAHETIHLLTENEWHDSFEKYKSISGWNQLAEGTKYRKGNFVEQDGQLSPEEDFANNVEHFMFEPGTLKSSNPDLFRWINTNLSRLLKIRSCTNAK